MRRGVFVYMRSIKLEVIVHERHVWEFMAEFGKAFAVEDSMSGTTTVRAVDSYFDHPGGWHVFVTIPEGEEERFRDFLESFCESRGIPNDRN